MRPCDEGGSSNVRCFWVFGLRRRTPILGPGACPKSGCLRYSVRLTRLLEANVADKKDWRDNGVRVVSGEHLDVNTAQTPGMNRAAAITHATAGAEKLWAGTVEIHPNAKTGAHHHGELESIIYIISGKARMRWGEQLEYVAEAGPGDFIYVPPFVPHQEINALEDEALNCVLVRSGQDPVVVNLEIPVVEDPSGLHWIDPIHAAP